jgi:hypothetical protein
MSVEFKIETNFPRLLNYWSSLYNKVINITKNKTAELQLTFSNNLITGINIFKYIHSDHSPFNVEVSIIGLTILFTVYDNRHWDYENNIYEGD